MRTKTEFSALLDGFVDAVANKDYDRAVLWCDTPCTIVRPTGAQLFDQPSAAAQDLRECWECYYDSGICDLRYTILDKRSYTEGVTLVDIDWELLDHRGHVPITFQSTYGMRRVADTLKIMFILGHNEIFQRPHRAEANPGHHSY